jgi:hypothetical protein
VMTALVLCARAAVPPRIAGLGMAVVGLLAWGGMGLGGYQGGHCFDVTGSYTLSFLGAALAGIANLLVIGALALKLRWQGRMLVWLRHRRTWRSARAASTDECQAGSRIVMDSHAICAAKSLELEATLGDHWLAGAIGGRTRP